MLMNASGSACRLSLHSLREIAVPRAVSWTYARSGPWAKQQRRQEAPCASKQIGAQGAVPQRAAKRLRGGNREAVEVSPAVAEQPVAVDPAPLRLEDVWGFLQA